MRQALLVCIDSSPLDLVLGDIQTRHVGARELDNLAGRTTDTAANIKDLHSRLDTHAVGQVVLVASYGAVESLTVGEAAEVEALTPSVLVEVRGQVVISCQSADGQELGEAKQLTVL